MSDFTCQDQTQARIDNCVICLQDKSIPLTAWEREENCEVHHIKRMFICGKGEKVCPDWILQCLGIAKSDGILQLDLVDQPNIEMK